MQQITDSTSDNVAKGWARYSDDQVLANLISDGFAEGEGGDEAFQATLDLMLASLPDPANTIEQSK
jgi:hypothetical protein